MAHSPLPDRSRGFTLIEVLVVIAILGLLGALIVPNFFRNLEQARVDAATSDVIQIKNAAKTFYVRESRPPSMQDLIDPPPELEGFDDIPLDPWDREYELLTEGAPHEWEVISHGPDGLAGTDDDISSRRVKRQRRSG